MNPQTIIKIGSAAGTLSAWYVARENGVEQWFPWIVVGGLAGAIITEYLVTPNSK